VTVYSKYRRLYDRMAPFYAPAMRVIPFWRSYTEAVLPYLPADGTILEIGTGPGVLLKKIAARYPFAVGLDLSPGMLRRARKRLRRARLVQANAIHIPFAAVSFDAIALTFAFSAIPDGQAAMDEMARVLRPGGVIALVDACDPGDGHRIAHGLAKCWEKFGDFMRDEAALMRAAGLEIVERREFGAFNSIRITVGRK
jgi:phosphatidylethanolamine/phosphatidyl-N-methylethanolamine N-methyltransferase